MATHPVVRGLHDVGLAIWTGGSLMGAIGLNGAAAALDDPAQRAHAATAGWNRWAPVGAAAVAAHLVGATGLLVTDFSRVRHQRGVLASSALKAAATGAGVGVAGWSAVLNRKMAATGPVPVSGATEPSVLTPADVARTQRQLKLVQWLNPAVGFGLLGLSAWQSEQQRPTEVAKGTLARLLAPAPLAAAAAVAGVGALAAAAGLGRSGGGSRPAPADSAGVDSDPAGVDSGLPVDAASPDVAPVAVVAVDVVTVGVAAVDPVEGAGFDVVEVVEVDVVAVDVVAVDVVPVDVVPVDVVAVDVVDVDAVPPATA